MCTPLMIIAGALGAAGSIFRGIAGARAGRMQAEIARKNAELILAGGRTRQSALRREVERTIGGQVAYYAANNLDPTVGAPALAIASSAGQGELDRQLIDLDARNRAAMARLQAQELQRGATQDLIGGFFGAGTAFLQAVM
jgi:hypothetical protein